MAFLLAASSGADSRQFQDGLARFRSGVESSDERAAFLRSGTLSRSPYIVRRENKSVIIHGSRSDTSGLSDQVLNLLCSGADPEDAGLSCASVAIFDSTEGLWKLHADFSGAFPIFYYAGSNCFWLSTRLRPLAFALESEPDATGIVEFVRLGYTIGPRTRFEGIRRLLPGQRLRARHDGTSLFVSEPRAGISYDWGESQTDAWQELGQATTRQLAGVSTVGLMTSGGWDSRLLLSMIGRSAPDVSIVCYSYGDPASRELRIAKELASLAGASNVVGQLGPDLLNVDFLRSYSGTSDTVLFPHWRQAGARLRELGCDIGVAGVLGEILGGHYGPPYYYPRWQKASRVYRLLLGAESKALHRSDLSTFWAYFLPNGDVPKPWSISSEWWHSQGDLSEAIRQDLSTELRRIQSTGVAESTALLERFTAEHRGARYQVEQLRALETQIDVGTPYIDSRSVRFLRSIPFRKRAYNRLACRLLSREDSQYAKLPLSSTLVPAGTPTLVRELSRGLRAGVENAQRHLNRVSRGRLPEPNYSYIDFSFVGERSVTEPLLAELQAEYWNQEALRYHYFKYDGMSRLERPNLHPHFDQLLKNLTVEWDIRPPDESDDIAGVEPG